MEQDRIVLEDQSQPHYEATNESTELQEFQPDLAKPKTQPMEPEQIVNDIPSEKDLNENCEEKTENSISEKAPEGKTITPTIPVIKAKLKGNKNLITKDTEKNNQNQTGTTSSYYQEYLKTYLANKYLTTKIQDQIVERDEILEKINNLSGTDMAVIEACSEKSDNECNGNMDSDKKRRARKKKNEVSRAHECPMEICSKSYGTQNSQSQHVKQKHPELWVSYRQKLIEENQKFCGKSQDEIGSQADDKSQLLINSGKVSQSKDGGDLVTQEEVGSCKMDLEESAENDEIGDLSNEESLL